MDESGRSLLDLPFEIRRYIFQYALIADEPIVAFISRECNTECDDLPGGDLPSDVESVQAGVRRLATGLLCTNRAISFEASQIFYGGNTFHFGRWHEWRNVVSWLAAIGAVNRRRLNSLSIHFRVPSKAWQHADGSRTAIKDKFLQLPVTRISELGQPAPPSYKDCLPGEWEQGEVDVIDPCVEDIFRLLGKAAGSTTSDQLARDKPLRLIFDAVNFPNWHLSASPHDGDYNTRFNVSSDFPNLAELWRRRHTMGPGRRKVEVLYRGDRYTGAPDSDLHDEFVDRKDEFEERGWEIVSTRPVKRMVCVSSVHEVNLITGSPVSPKEWKEVIDVEGTLVWKGYSEPLVADVCDIFSWRLPPGSEIEE